MAASTAGLSQLRSGCSGMKECRYHCSVASSHVHARPQRSKADIQLFGGPPPGAESRHTYQSRLGSSREEREATNHAWRSEVWLGTQSTITRMPRAWASATRWSKSASVPKTGWTSV